MPQIIHEPQQWQQLCDMAKNQNALVASIKSPEKHTNKHSMPFYISPTLFDNKRLKQKRAKWTAACQLLQQEPSQHYQLAAHASHNRASKKTDFIGRRVAPEPAVTINLLSDEDDDGDTEIEHQQQQQKQMQSIDGAQYDAQKKLHSRVIMPGPPPLAPIQGIHLQPNIVNGQQQPLQHFLVYPGNIPGLQLSNASNIRLIPLSHISLDALQQQTLELQKLKNDEQQQTQQHKQQHLQKSQQQIYTQHHQQQLLPQQQSKQQLKTASQGKRKRKSHQPKRHAQPTIVNNESIVLTDDSDTESHEPPQQRQQQFSNSPRIAPATLHPPPPVTAIAVPTIVHSSTANKHMQQQTILSPKVTPATSPVRIAQVDEEVTVSLVPRSSTGSCSTKANSKLFPMQPDETTVHTVIANRIYELSLTKLREGLGIDGENNGQLKPNPTRRKGKTNGPMPSAADVPQESISLKLSSDLSISLISDDDDEDEDADMMHQPFKLQLPPHLAVQQVHLPAAATAADTGQLPRRRKLG